MAHRYNGIIWSHKNEVLIHATKLMNLEDVMLSEIDLLRDSRRPLVSAMGRTDGSRRIAGF